MNWICKAGKDNLAAAENSPPSLKTASLTSFGRRKTMVAANPLLHNSSSSSLSNNIGTMMSHSLALLISLMPSQAAPPAPQRPARLAPSLLPTTQYDSQTSLVQPPSPLSPIAMCIAETIAQTNYPLTLNLVQRMYCVQKPILCPYDLLILKILLLYRI